MKIKKDIEMTGWIIYSKEDVEKNRNYIQMYVEKFKDYNVIIETIITEDINNFSEYIKRHVPDFAINRSRNDEIAAELERTGVRVFNSSAVTAIANNKGKNYEYLAGVVPFLPVQYGNHTIVSGIEGNDFQYPYVIKSCRGHGGSQVFMVHNEQEENEAIKAIDAANSMMSVNEWQQKTNYVVQQCCSDLGKDVRVYIIGNKIVAAVLRTSSESFKSNYSLGGNVEQYQLNDKEEEMVHAITQKLPLDYAGIDFTFHNGKAVFNEIEDAVGARMLYQVSDMDIVQEYVDYIIEEIRN